jgi:hypothetical protein
MYATTLAAFIAFIAVFTVIVTRPTVTAGNARRKLTCHAAARATDQPAQSEQFPRLSRNRWARRDISRVLMTDDDYTGRITPHRDETH